MPVQFIIGENSILNSLDEMEDFRERMVKSETSLVVVGGADDSLTVSNLKKRMDCLTQFMVDRCVCDEIFEFLHMIISNYREETFVQSQEGHLAASTPIQSCLKKKSSSRKRSNVVVVENYPPGSVVPHTHPDFIGPQPKPKRRRPPPKPKQPKPLVDSNAFGVLNNPMFAMDPRFHQPPIDFPPNNLGSIKVDKSKVTISGSFGGVCL